MTSPARVRAASAIALISFLTIVAGWAVMGVLGDRAWWALPVLYGPRWPWLFVVTGMMPYAWVSPRRGTLPGIAALVIVMIGIVDWRFGLAKLAPAEGPLIRIMTLNAGVAASVPQSPRILEEIRRVDADVVVLTECNGNLPAALRTLPSTYQLRVATETSNCLLSRGLINAWSERDPADAFRQNGSGAIQSAELLLPQGVVRVGLVHLATPRDALEEFRDISRIPSLGKLTRENTNEREEESVHAREWIDRGVPMPLVIAGDFNMPIESAIYRETGADTETRFPRWDGARGIPSIPGGGVSASITCCRARTFIRCGASSEGTSGQTICR